MTPIKFPGSNVVFAEDQPQYNPLPAHRDRDDLEGTLTVCWKLSWRERLIVLFTGKLWHQVMTFNQPLQPQLLAVVQSQLMNSEKLETAASQK